MINCCIIWFYLMRSIQKCQCSLLCINAHYFLSHINAKFYSVCIIQLYYIHVYTWMYHVYMPCTGIMYECIHATHVVHIHMYVCTCHVHVLHTFHINIHARYVCSMRSFMYVCVHTHIHVHVCKKHVVCSMCAHLWNLHQCMCTTCTWCTSTRYRYHLYVYTYILHTYMTYSTYMYTY